MKESNYWQQFINTGRVEDYLKFRETADASGRTGEYAAMGENPYAGIHKINGNGFEDGAYRGIR